MKYGVYSIRDAYTGFLPPTFDINDMSASRNLAHALRNPDLLFGSAPQDYDLYYLGEFDSDDGSIVTTTPRLVVSAVSLLKEVGKSV